jgi:lysyl-tRNA synthetase class 2
MIALRLAPTGAARLRATALLRLALGFFSATVGTIDAVVVDNGALGTVGSLTLVWLAVPLARGMRRAWLVAVPLALIVAVHPIALDVDAVGLWLGVWLAVALVISTPAFNAGGDPATRPVLGVAAVLVLIAGVVDVLDARGVIAHPLVLTTLGASVILTAWSLVPRREKRPATSAQWDKARDLVERYGVDTLAPFALRRDKRFFFADASDACLAYRVVAGVALVSGDPIGDVNSHPQVIERFVAFADQHGWIPAAIGLSPRGLEVWRAQGFGAHYTGEEAIVDTATFTLDGRRIRKVRQSVHRLTKAGYTVEVLNAADVTSPLREELAGVAEGWRGEARETGFSMAFDGTSPVTHRDDRYAVAFDAERRVGGFLHLGWAPAASALSLSSMRRDRHAPNGLNEFLVCRTIDWARQEGIRQVSLNFAAFAAILDPPGPVDYVTRAEGWLLRRFSGRFQLERLASYNRKFFPRWVPRYAAYPSATALPRIGLAAMLAEAYVTAPWSRS